MSARTPEEIVGAVPDGTITVYDSSTVAPTIPAPEYTVPLTEQTPELQLGDPLPEIGWYTP